jgi:hypothetical protein
MSFSHPVDWQEGIHVSSGSEKDAYAEGTPSGQHDIYLQS